MAYLHSKHLLPILSSILIFLSSLSFAANTGGTLPQAAPSTPFKRGGYTQEEHLANIAAARRKSLERMSRENMTRELRSRGAYETGTAYDAQRAADYYRDQYARAKAENNQIGMKRYKELMDRATDLAQKNLRYSAADKLNRPDDIAMYERYMREQQAGSRSTSKSKRKKSSPVYQYGGVVILLAVIAGAIFYVRRKKRALRQKVSRRKKRRIKKIAGNNFDAFPQYNESTTPSVPLPNTPTDKFYICKPGCTQEGPYPEEMIRTCFKQGVFPADTRIWYEGAPEWMPIQNICAVAQAAAIASPLLHEKAVYYVTYPGMQPQGPYSRSHVMSRYYQGSYPAGTKVWSPDTEDWIPIEGLQSMAHPLVNSAIPAYQHSLGRVKNWSPVTAFSSCMKRYAQFSGRASRSEYWFFLLAYLILFVLITLVANALTIATEIELLGTIILLIFILGSIIPSLAVQVRRLHDRDLSAWSLLLLLLPCFGLIVLLIMSCLPSKNVHNPYGTAPLPPV